MALYSSEDSDASGDQPNGDDKNSEDVGSDEESDPEPQPANEPKTNASGKKVVALAPKIIRV